MPKQSAAEDLKPEVPFDALRPYIEPHLRQFGLEVPPARTLSDWVKKELLFAPEKRALPGGHHARFLHPRANIRRVYCTAVLRYYGFSPEEIRLWYDQPSRWFAKAVFSRAINYRQYPSAYAGTEGQGVGAAAVFSRVVLPDGRNIAFDYVWLGTPVWFPGITQDRTWGTFGLSDLLNAKEWTIQEVLRWTDVEPEPPPPEVAAQYKPRPEDRYFNPLSDRPGVDDTPLTKVAQQWAEEARWWPARGQNPASEASRQGAPLTFPGGGHR